MSNVPITTLPESPYNPLKYDLGFLARRSPLLAYLLTITHGSATGLVVAYILGYFLFSPLLEKTASRRYDYLELFRGRLRDFYLNLAGRVRYVPQVAINKNDGSGKLYADAICQTEESHMRSQYGSEDSEEEDQNDKLSQAKLLSRLGELTNRLRECEAIQSIEVPHFTMTKNSVRELQEKTNSSYLSSEIYEGDDSTTTTTTTTNTTTPKTNRATMQSTIKEQVRSIKGLFMTGQV